MLGSSPPGTAALVGRSSELLAVRAAFDDAAAGRPALVLLVGEAGIGKTRLADEAALIARAAGTRVLRGEADAASREPMELWRGVYRALGIVAVSDPSLRAEERRWEHLESLVDALVSCSPVLVVLDDLHWADAMAIWVLEHLPRALGDASVAVLATSRDHEPDMPALDGLRQVSRLIQLGGLDVEAVGRLAATETSGAVDAAGLRARTGGNPLFVLELMRAPDGGAVIGDVLDRSLGRLDADTRELLAAAALAGPGTPLAVIAAATSTSTAAAAAERLRPAARQGVLDEVGPTGVRFHHSLLSDAAGRLADAHGVHARLADAWDGIGGPEGRAAAVGHRLRGAMGAAAVADAVRDACVLAADLVASGLRERAAGLLRDAHEACADCADRPQLRATVALDLADILSWLGDLDPALSLYQEAAELARGSSDPVTRARAEIGANLWATAFVPDLPRMRRLQDALDALPPDELHLRATLLGRLTIDGGADVDATERVRAWSEEAVAVARSTGDPVLIAQSLLDQTQAVTSRSALDAGIVATDEVIRLAERAGRSDLVVAGHQRRAGYHLNHADIGAANQSLGRAEVLAALQPNPWWRYSTLLQRTTLLALSGSRSAAAASMDEAVRVGTGHVEPVVVLAARASTPGRSATTAGV